jgi:SNF family Na+-dependent transporter
MRGLEALYIGTALGIGNFLVLPQLFSLYDFRIVLFFHFLGLLMLGVPLVVGEILWARWLRRSFVEAFQFLGAPYSWTPAVSLAALLAIVPVYVLEMMRLLVNLGSVLRLLPSRIALDFQHPIVFVIGILFMAAIWGYTLLPRRWIGTFFAVGLAVSIVALLSALAIQLPSYRNFFSLNFSPTRNFAVTKEMFLDVSSFSLFTVSSGLGIHFLFTWWASPFRRNMNRQSEYWKVPGRVHRIAIKVLLADFALSVFVTALVLPWISSPRGSQISGVGFQQIFLEWMPEFFRASEGGLLSVSLLLFGLLGLGFLSLASLYEVLVHGVQRVLGLKRMRASLLVTGFVGVFALVASVKFFGRPLEALAFDLLLPCAALLWSLSVGQKLPKRDLSVLVGRSPSSDSMNLLWRLSLKYWVPAFLSVYLVLRVLSWIF